MKQSKMKKITSNHVEQLLCRALLFLRGAGTIPPIQRALTAVGYTAAEHAAGWALVEHLAGRGAKIQRGRSPDLAAIAQLEAIEDALLTRTRAALHRFHPEHLAVFKGLTARNGDAAHTLQEFLKRLDRLETVSPKAMAVLELRGFDAAERKRLAVLVKQAMHDTGEHAESNGGAAPAADFAKLREWYDEWASAAFVALPPRLLARIGLAPGRRRPPEEWAPHTLPSRTTSERHPEAVANGEHGPAP